MSRFVKSNLFSVAAALLIVGVLTSCQRAASAGTVRKMAIERGEYLVRSLDCAGCHTPMKLGLHGPEPDLSRNLSGHPEGFKMGEPPALGKGGWVWAGAGTNTAYTGPWGISYASNLTSDVETGLGMWTEEMFVKAIREGKKQGGGRPLQPPMPWPAYSNLTDEDLKAIFAYLSSLDPIVNHVPELQPPS
jgi:mono/diheme cytochrome c family protein